MSKLYKLAGKVFEYDKKFNRLKIRYPSVKEEKDPHNVHLILDAKDKNYGESLKLEDEPVSHKHFWSPNYDTMFIVKLDKKCFCYDQFQSLVKDYNEIINKNVVMEAYLMDFVNSSFIDDERYGWYINIVSIKLV